MQLKFIADSIKELQRDMGSLKTELNVTQSSLTAEANDDLLGFSRKLDSFYTAKSAKLADLQVVILSGLPNSIYRYTKSC